jgi:hypothetical protein
MNGTAILSDSLPLKGLRPLLFIYFPEKSILYLTGVTHMENDLLFCSKGCLQMEKL